MSINPPPKYRPKQNVSPSSLFVLVSLGVFALTVFGVAVETVWRALFHGGPVLRRDVPVEVLPGGAYHIPALELSLECDSKPFAGKQLDKYIKGRRDIVEYAGYRSNDPNLKLLVMGYWYREPRNLMYVTDEVEKSMKRRFSAFTDCTVNPVVVGGEPGRVILVKYKAKGYLLASEVAVVMHGNAHYSFEASLAEFPDQREEKRFDQILRSVRFDPLR